jgi:hypothetical protein
MESRQHTLAMIGQLWLRVVELEHEVVTLRAQLATPEITTLPAGNGEHEKE